jgi:hypothetical protein
MYAIINLPGSSHFQAFGPANKAECEAWLQEKKTEHQEMHGGAWAGTYLPAKVVTNAEARSWRYRDGSRVVE